MPHVAARIGADTLIQRFGSALNLNINIRFHMLFLDGAYVVRPDGFARFPWVKVPTSHELTRLAHMIAYRVGRFLERQGLRERDADNSYLTLDAVNEAEERTPVERHAAMTWVQRLKRVFNIDICGACGGAVKAIACLEDPVVINRLRGGSLPVKYRWI